MRLALVFNFIVLGIGQRPKVPILYRDKVELRKDVRYSMSVEEIRKLEKLHVQEMPILNNPENYYLLHQTDYCTLYDIEENRPVAVFATIQGPIKPRSTKRFAFKRMDPR